MSSVSGVFIALSTCEHYILSVFTHFLTFFSPHPPWTQLYIITMDVFYSLRGRLFADSLCVFGAISCLTVKNGLRLCFKETKKKERSVKNNCVGGRKVWRHWVLMMCSGVRTYRTVCTQIYVEFPWNDTLCFERVQRFTGSTFLFILTALYEYIVSWYAPCWANPDSHCLWIIEHPGRRDEEKEEETFLNTSMQNKYESHIDVCTGFHAAVACIAWC